MDAKQNGKLPAYGEGLQEMVDRHGNSSFAHVGQGLTKREAFAMAALTGMMPCEDCTWSDESPARYAKVAVQCADALLKELEND